MHELSPTVQQAIAFTEAYRTHQDSHPAVRELACLRTQFPALLQPLTAQDTFAGGHSRERITYVGSIWWAMMPDRSGPAKQAGYCIDFDAPSRFARSDADRTAIADILAFWEQECTWTKIRRTWDEDMRRGIGRDHAIIGGGAGFMVAMDLDTLLQAGLPGTLARVSTRLDAAAADGDDKSVSFLSALREVLELVIRVCRHYEAQAQELAAAADDETTRCRLDRMAESLAAIAERAPGNLHEAIQLWWLYSLMTCGLHIEGWRLDVALGDFYAAETDKSAAREMIRELWRLFAQHSDPAVTRVIVGGRGRRNEANADQFSLAAMDVTRELHQVIPQLTLRFHDGQNPDLLSRAFDVLADGTTFPMLYNDDVIIPGVAEALHVDEAGAVDYYPLGCGEYMIGGSSPSLLNVVWSIPKSLEAAMRSKLTENGGGFASFDELRRAVAEQFAGAAELAARMHARNNAVLSRECAFLLASCFTNDCIEQGRSVIDGGARYTGACIMGHGFSNAADALVAIRELVFDQKEIDQATLLNALEADFEGYEPLRRRLLSMPKFGNDDAEADNMLVEIWREINELTDAAGTRAGIGFFTVSSVNPGGFHFGTLCGATADGRRAHTPFAIGNAPSAGADSSGLTAMLNSAAKVDPANGGATTNVKLARSMFTEHRAKLESVFDAFWKRGGIEATLTVVDQEELEDALEHPERYPNLLVRLGGWTARFVDLEPDFQRKIIERTAY